MSKTIARNRAGKELSKIRSRLEVLLDNIEDSMRDIEVYKREIRDLLIESGERL